MKCLKGTFIDLLIGPQAYHKINDTILNYSKNKIKIENTNFEADAKFDYLSKIKNTNKKFLPF